MSHGILLISLSPPIKYRINRRHLNIEIYTSLRLLQTEELKSVSFNWDTYIRGRRKKRKEP